MRNELQKLIDEQAADQRKSPRGRSKRHRPDEIQEENEELTEEEDEE
jgi:hypothetical protein